MMRPIVLMLMVLSNATAARCAVIDTLAVPRGGLVSHVAVAGVYDYAISGNRLLQRTRSLPWRYMHRNATSSQLLDVRNESIRVVDTAHVLHHSTNAGRTWLQQSIPNEVEVLVNAGTAGFGTWDCQDGNRVFLLYDVGADTVRYVESDVPCSASYVVATSDTAVYVTAITGAGASERRTVYVMSTSAQPLQEWQFSVASGAAYASRVQGAGVGLWYGSTMLVSRESTADTLTMPFDPLQIGYPHDVLFGDGAWWFTLNNGLYKSVDGSTWQRQPLQSALAPFRCWSVDSTRMLFSADGIGTFLWTAQGRAAYNQGMIGVDPGKKLVTVADRVAHVDSWMEDGRSIVAWGDEEHNTTIDSLSYGDLGARNMSAHQGRFWTYGQSLDSFDPATLERRSESASQVPAFAVAALGEHSVIWQGNALRIRTMGSSEWKMIVANIVNEDPVLGLIGLQDRVLVVSYTTTDQDELILYARAFAADGEEIVGPRTIAVFSGFSPASRIAFGVVETVATVWTGSALHTSDDGGRTWLRQPVPFVQSSTPWFGEAHVTVWADQPRGIWQTSNGGLHWVRIVVPEGIERGLSVAETSLHYHLLTHDGVLRIPKAITHSPQQQLPDAINISVSGSMLRIASDVHAQMCVMDIRGSVVANGTTPTLYVGSLAAGLYHCIVTTSTTTIAAAIYIPPR